MSIGCITLVPVNQQWPGDYRQVAAINCIKGRGLIMPGGKWENPEFYEQAAYREFQEETGQRLDGLPKLLFQAPDGHGYHVFTFLGSCPGFGPYVHTTSGETRFALWVDLMKSFYGPYYSVLKQHVEAKGFYCGEC
jgi:8-oxo-dGTP pyrophosphatase MutT (NUDIX family)